MHFDEAKRIQHADNSSAGRRGKRFPGRSPRLGNGRIILSILYYIREMSSRIAASACQRFAELLGGTHFERARMNRFQNVRNGIVRLSCAMRLLGKRAIRKLIRIGDLGTGTLLTLTRGTVAGTRSTAGVGWAAKGSEGGKRGDILNLPFISAINAYR